MLLTVRVAVATLLLDVAREEELREDTGKDTELDDNDNGTLTASLVVTLSGMSGLHRN